MLYESVLCREKKCTLAARKATDEGRATCSPAQKCIHSLIGISWIATQERFSLLSFYLGMRGGWGLLQHVYRNNERWRTKSFLALGGKVWRRVKRRTIFALATAPLRSAEPKPNFTFFVPFARTNVQFGARQFREKKRRIRTEPKVARD